MSVKLLGEIEGGILHFQKSLDEAFVYRVSLT